MRNTLLLLVLPVLACRTPCQTLCVRMADYAAECGITVSEGEIDACIDAQGAGDADQGACARANDADTLRQEWACEDLQVFFD